VQIVIDRDPTYMAKLSSGGSTGEKELRRSAMDRSARIHAGFVGSFGGAQVSPRGLTSQLITRLVCVEGIITRCTSVRPKVARSVHFNPADKEFMSREYRDATDPYGLPTGSVYPTKTEDGKPLQTEFGLSTYKDHQVSAYRSPTARACTAQDACTSRFLSI
jgi:DNA replicative helicase MCM subunit Mcm2 (Cdc46/Mcm family)